MRLAILMILAADGRCGQPLDGDGSALGPFDEQLQRFKGLVADGEGPDPALPRLELWTSNGVAKTHRFKAFAAATEIHPTEGESDSNPEDSPTPTPTTLLPAGPEGVGNPDLKRPETALTDGAAAPEVTTPESETPSPTEPGSEESDPPEDPPPATAAEPGSLAPRGRKRRSS